MPPLLNQDGYWAELDSSLLNPARLSGRDFRFLLRYSRHPWELAWNWVGMQLAPCFTHRFCILGELAPDWMPVNNPIAYWRHERGVFGSG